MITVTEALAMRSKAIANIDNLKVVKSHLVDSKEFQLSRETQEKINRYWRDVKILDLVLGEDSPYKNNPPTNVDND